MKFETQSLRPPLARTVTAAAKPSPLWMLAGLSSLAMLLFIRNPWVALQPQLWHEDAIIFLNQQRAEGWAAIIHPYGGYLLLFPRLITALAALLPLELTPHTYLIGTFVGWLWVGGLILTSPLFASPRWAFFAALAWAAVPHGGEVFLNLTNVQWALAAGLALLLAEGPANRGPYTQWLFVGLTVLTGPFSILLSPLAIWRLWNARRNHGPSDMIAPLTLLAAGIQLVIVLSSSDRMQQAALIDPARLALILGTGVFPEIFGTKGTFPADIALRLAGTTAGLAGVGYASWTAIPGATTRRPLLVGSFLILLSGLLSVMGTQGRAPMAFGGGQRYLFVPFSLYAWALISASSYASKNDRTRVLAPVLLFVIGYHSSGNFTTARHEAADWPAACRLIRAGHAAEIQVGPYDGRVIILPDRHSVAAPPKP